MKRKNIIAVLVIMVSLAGIPLFAHSYRNGGYGSRDSGRGCYGYHEKDAYNGYSGHMRGRSNMNENDGRVNDTTFIGTVKSVDTANQIIEVTNADNVSKKIRINPLTHIAQISADNLRNSASANPRQAENLFTAASFDNIKTGNWVRINVYPGETENLDARSITIIEK